MKFQVSFKTPDAISDALVELSDSDVDELSEFCGKWVEYGEYVTLEFDSVKGTCRVVEV